MPTIDKYKQRLRDKYNSVSSKTIYFEFDESDRDFRDEFGKRLIDEGIVSSYEVLGLTKFHCELTDQGIDALNNDTVVNIESADHEETAKVICRKCGAEIEADQNFCPKCGTPVKRICPKCSTELEADQEYCPKCGTKYSDSLKPIDIKNSANSLKTNIGNNKKKIIGIIAAAVLLVGAYFGFKALSKPSFEKMIDHVVSEHPDEPEYEGFLKGNGADLILTRAVKIGDNGKWMIVDSNPTDTDSDDMLDFQKLHLYNVTDALIVYTNSQLGFSDLVYEDMQKTTWSMGIQNAESDKATVKWTYHPDKGLEVTYTLK